MWLGLLLRLPPQAGEGHLPPTPLLPYRPPQTIMEEEWGIWEPTKEQVEVMALPLLQLAKDRQEVRLWMEGRAVPLISCVDLG